MQYKSSNCLSRADIEDIYAKNSSRTKDFEASGGNCMEEGASQDNSQDNQKMETRGP